MILIQLTPDELTEIIDRAVETAINRHMDARMSRDELAVHFGVTTRTIDNWIAEHRIKPVTPKGKHKKYSLREVTLTQAK